MHKLITTAATMVFGIALALIGFTAGSASAAPVSAPITCEAAPEYMPANACNGPLTTRDDLARFNLCDDAPVVVDAGGVIVGDANRNGWLDGTDCGTSATARDEAVDCSAPAVAAALADLWNGNYDGLLSTCIGVDEDSPIVDAVLTAVGK